MTPRGEYTTYLGAGLGVLAETRILLDLWEPGVTAPGLYRSALESGRFPRQASRRVKNIVDQCFARRFLAQDGAPALWLKTLAPRISTREFDQLAFVYTCRANPILADFVTRVYWPRYAAGQPTVSNEEARQFVAQAAQQGRTAQPWAPSTIRRVAGYLTGACADFGLLENGKRTTRRIIPLRIEPGAAAALAYDLHFAGLGDNAVVVADDWKLFGMDQPDVVAELKRLSLRGLLIVQGAANVTRIGWKCQSLEELTRVLAA